jgi:DNA mismatch endonuclease, patch repair protein
MRPWRSCSSTSLPKSAESRAVTASRMPSVPPPVPRDEGVASRMRKQASSATKPERDLVRELTRRGFRVEQNVRTLPGSPDVVLPVRGIAIFVNGCFWHGCPRHFTPPKHNRRWWSLKIEANRARDRRRSAQLRRAGWSVLTVWEHTDPAVAAARVQRLARSRRRRLVPGPGPN